MPPLEPAAIPEPAPLPPPLRRSGWPELVGLAFLHRLILALWTSTVASDSTWYLRAAESFAGGRYREAMDQLHPLYPLLTGLLSTIFGNAERSAVVLSVIAGSLVPLPLYLLVRRLWNERIAWVTGFLYAVHPMLALETSEALPTALFLVLFFAAAACGVGAYASRRWYLYPLAGAFASLCYLTRTEGVQAVAFLGTAAAVAALRLLRRKPAEPATGPSRAQFAAGVLAGILAFGLVSLPYLLFIKEKTGKWGFTLKGAGQDILSKTLNSTPKQDSPEAAPPPPASTVGAGRESPVRFVGKKLGKAMFPPLVVLTGIGFFCTRRQGGRWGSAGLLFFIGILAFLPSLLLLGLSSNYRPSHRYLLLSAVLWLPWAAAAVLTISDVLSRLVRSPSAARVVLPALLGLVLLLFPLKSLGPRRAEESVYREVGAWLAEQKLPSRIVMGSNEKPVYYGKCDIVPMPVQYGDPDEVPGTSRVKTAPVDPEVQARVQREWARQVEAAYVQGHAVLLVLDEAVLTHYDLGLGALSELTKLGFRSLREFGDRSRRAAVVRVLALESR